MQTVVWIGESRDKIATVIPGLGMKEPSLEITDRGDYPNYGSGPYVKLKADPIGIITDGVAQEFYSGETRGAMRYHVVRHSSNQVEYYSIWDQWSSYGCYTYITREAYEYFTSGTLTDWYYAARYNGVKTRAWGGASPVPDEDMMSLVELKDWDTSTWGTVLGPWWIVQNGRITDWGKGHLITCDMLYPDYDLGLLQTFHSILDCGIWPGYYASRFAGAYSEALSALDGAGVNQLGTILELAQTAAGLYQAVKNPMESLLAVLRASKDPRELWLSYRYSYTTTKLDVDSLVELNQTIDVLQALCKDTFSLHGSVYDDGARFSAALKLPLTTVIGELKSLKAYGFEVSGADLWDIVPYSFIVDWFLRIGPLLERFEQWGGSISIEPSEVWYSYYQSSNGLSQYMRVPGRRLEAVPTYTDMVTSRKTIRMRIADTISLFS